MIGVGNRDTKSSLSLGRASFRAHLLGGSPLFCALKGHKPLLFQMIIQLGYRGLINTPLSYKLNKALTFGCQCLWSMPRK